MTNLNELNIVGEYNELTEEQKEFYRYELELTQKLIEVQQDKIKEIEEEQKSNKEAILLLLLGLIKGIEISDGILNISEKESKKIIKKINKEINNISKNEIINEKTNINEILNDVIEKGYDINSYIRNKGDNGYKPKNISKKDKNKIMGEKIEGLTHEGRLKNNKNNLFDTIKNEIGIFLTGSISLDILKTQLEKDLDSNKFMSNRLIKDQITRKLNQSKIIWNKDNDIKEKLYNSILCSTSCKSCVELHGKIFKIDDETIQIPRHINCYCYWSSVINFSVHWIDDVNWDDFIDWESGDK